MKGPEIYDLKSVELPRLTGKQLSIVANVLENSILKKAILPSMLKTGGIENFRSLIPDEPPTVFPLAFTDKPALAVEGPDLNALDKIHDNVSTQIPYKTIRSFVEAYREGKTYEPV